MILGVKELVEDDDSIKKFVLDAKDNTRDSLTFVVITIASMFNF